MTVAATRDDMSAVFFDSAGNGVLLLRRCDSCGRYLSPDHIACPDCGQGELSWAPSIGDARLVSWAVVHPRAAPDSGRVESPFVVGLVEMAEGPWSQSRIVGASPAELEAGTSLRCEFIAPEGGETIPVFRVTS
jgi:uncharacterized OB-fold protein